MKEAIRVEPGTVPFPFKKLHELAVTATISIII